MAARTQHADRSGERGPCAPRSHGGSGAAHDQIRTVAVGEHAAPFLPAVVRRVARSVKPRSMEHGANEHSGSAEALRHNHGPESPPDVGVWHQGWHCRAHDPSTPRTDRNGRAAGHGPRRPALGGAPRRQRPSDNRPRCSRGGSTGRHELSVPLGSRNENGIPGSWPVDTGSSTVRLGRNPRDRCTSHASSIDTEATG